MLGNWPRPADPSYAHSMFVRRINLHRRLETPKTDGEVAADLEARKYPKNSVRARGSCGEADFVAAHSGEQPSGLMRRAGAIESGKSSYRPASLRLFLRILKFALNSY